MYTFRSGARRFAVGLAGVCLVVGAVSGCGAASSGFGSQAGFGLNSPGLGSGPVTVINTDDEVSPAMVTEQRASYVVTMLENSFSRGPATEGGAMSVISGYGGGYVTDAVMSGAPGAAEKLTLTVVLGAGEVRDSMQGEVDFGPSVVGCYTFVLGYYGTQVSDAEISCPSTVAVDDLTAVQAVASRQIGAQADAEQYTNAQLAQIPDSIASAEEAIHFSAAGGYTAGVTSSTPMAEALTSADFATGTDAVQHKPDAGLAIPRSDGSCLFVVYRWIQSSWVGGGSAGSSDSAVAEAWAAPTGAHCGGADALAAGAFLTVDRYAGG